MRDERSLLQAVLGDGRFLIALTGISLALSGGFAILQSVSGELLPHDSHALGMNSAALVHVGNHRLLGFMFHDRVAFGGSILAIGLGYLWLAEFPMSTRSAWAWWALIFSGSFGFLAFLTYLGQGYLDTWHGVATLFLLPVFCCGLWRSRPENPSLRALLRSMPGNANTWTRWGRLLLSLCAAGLILAGFTIALYGMTTVFVPSDLKFIGLDHHALQQISPVLIPLISHDRASFGGGLFSVGMLLIFMARFAELNRSLIEVVFLMGLMGFGCAIGVHFAVGYLDFLHLLPAFVGFLLFLLAAGCLAVGRSEEHVSRAATDEAVLTKVRRD